MRPKPLAPQHALALGSSTCGLLGEAIMLP